MMLQRKRMDSQATEAINENQTRVAASMDEAVAIEQLPVPPLAEAPPRTPTVPQPLPSSPLLTPRPPTPMMSQTREQSIDPRSLQSPPTPDIRTSPLQRRPHSSSQAKEETPRKVPATPISPVHQPIFSPVREQTPMSETRRVLFQTMHSPLTHHVTSNQSSRLRHQRLRAGPTAFAQHHNALDTITLKAMDTLLLQVLGSLRKMESSFPQLPSRQLHLILTL
ncbi:hypothetical protein MHU86_22986 [Fragilaria crotonensis]|nr:hypothetical protein MHU86_22986 [Fragilaria crotonensis]